MTFRELDMLLTYKLESTARADPNSTLDVPTQDEIDALMERYPDQTP